MVLDASAALAWLFEDELDDQARAMALAVAKSGAVVPMLFRLEMQNALLLAIRRKRLSRDVVEARFEDLDLLNIAVDTHASNAAFKSGFSLAERFSLSAYDANYLELASRLGKPLMTRDARLAAAARELHVLWEAPKPESP